MQYVQILILKQEIGNLVLSDSLSLKGFFLFCRFMPVWLKSLQSLLVRPMDLLTIKTPKLNVVFTGV
jgi:hypothetical protein